MLKKLKSAIVVLYGTINRRGVNTTRYTKMFVGIPFRFKIMFQAK